MHADGGGVRPATAVDAAAGKPKADWVEARKGWLESWEVLLKCVTWTCGAGFVIYQLLTGWLFVNMEVMVTTERKALDGRRDHLAFTVTFDKGSTDSVKLKDVQARVTPFVRVEVGPGKFESRLDEARAMVCEVHGFQMVGERPAGRAAWDSMEGRRLVMSPGEKVSFAGYVEVPREGVYLVEVVVLGDRRFYRMTTRRHIQWKTAVVSLPGAGLRTEVESPPAAAGAAPPAAGVPR